MARCLHANFEQAKATRNIDVAVQYLIQKVDGSVYSLRDIPIACGKGCSHCCTAWVSARSPVFGQADNGDGSGRDGQGPRGACGGQGI